tara:strand:+ start:528 stop:770 length:243 start_codon:yes stop_codon:yes gene_type:complete
MQGSNSYKSGQKVKASSPTKYAHKSAVKEGDIIEIENEMGLFEVMKVSSTNQIVAKNYEGYRVEIPKTEVRYNHKKTLDL